MHSTFPQLALAALLVSPSLVAGTVWYEGCYSSAGSLKLKGSNNFQTHASCIQDCGSNAVAATTSGNQCYCGNSLPSDVVPDSKCDIPCLGYPDEKCGGKGTFTVYLTGQGTLGSDPGSSGSSSAASPTTGSDATTAAPKPNASTSKPAKPESTGTTLPTPGPDPLQTQTSSTSGDATSGAATDSTTPTSSAQPSQSSSAASNGAASAGSVLGFLGVAVAAFL